MTSKLFIAAAACLLLFGAGWGCEEKCSDDYYDYTPDPPRSYFFFPEGSWWAYENSVTGEVDTLTAGPLGGEVYTRDEGADSPVCKAGYREDERFVFNDGRYFFISSITRSTANVELRINMRDSFNTNYSFEWNLTEKAFRADGFFAEVESDTVFNLFYSRTIPSLRCTKTSFTSDTAWFSSDLGLVRLSYGDTVLQLKDYRIL